MEEKSRLKEDEKRRRIYHVERYRVGFLGLRVLPVLREKTIFIYVLAQQSHLHYLHLVPRHLAVFGPKSHHRSPRSDIDSL